MYKIIRIILRFLVCKLLFRVNYENLEILEKYDKCLICPNHSRIFDPIFLYPKIESMYSVAKSEAFNNKLLAHFLRHHNVIPINRNTVDVTGTKRILNTLKEHNKIRLLLFPEGGIFKENYMENKRKVRKGAIYLAASTNLPIIPVHITSRAPFFSKVTVKFLSPFEPNKEVLKDKKLLKNEAKKLIHLIYED